MKKVIIRCIFTLIVSSATKDLISQPGDFGPFCEPSPIYIHLLDENGNELFFNNHFNTENHAVETYPLMGSDLNYGLSIESMLMLKQHYTEKAEFDSVMRHFRIEDSLRLIECAAKELDSYNILKERRFRKEIFDGDSMALLPDLFRIGSKQDRLVFTLGKKEMIISLFNFSYTHGRCLIDSLVFQEGSFVIDFKKDADYSYGYSNKNFKKTDRKSQFFKRFYAVIHGEKIRVDSSYYYGNNGKKEYVKNLNAYLASVGGSADQELLDSLGLEIYDSYDYCSRKKNGNVQVIRKKDKSNFDLIECPELKSLRNSGQQFGYLISNPEIARPLKLLSNRVHVLIRPELSKEEIEKRLKNFRYPGGKYVEDSEIELMYWPYHDSLTYVQVSLPLSWNIGAINSYIEHLKFNKYLNGSYYFKSIVSESIALACPTTTPEESEKGQSGPGIKPSQN